MQSGGGVSVRVGQVLLLLGAALWLTACDQARADGVESQARPHTPGCQAPSGISSRPRSIDETVALANALPQPLTLPCFVEALERPLRLHATQSKLSAQPAVGEANPRVFIYLDTLLLSVAPAGVGAGLIEMGEARADYRSLKAELVFPIREPVAAGFPYEHALFTDDLTACAFCHADEVAEPLPAGGVGYVSQALRPARFRRVSLAALAAERETCDPEVAPERCALLAALFDWGLPDDWDFPEEMATFGD